MQNTLEARAIPHLKKVADAMRKQSEEKALRARAGRQVARYKWAKRRLKGIVSDLAISTAEYGYRGYGSEIILKTNRCRFAVKLLDDDECEAEVLAHELREIDNSKDDREAKALCNRASFALDICTKAGKLRNLASYIRTITGSTKASLALSDAEFGALVHRYVADETADKSCRI